MPRSKNHGNSTTPRPYASRGTTVSKGGVLSKESASYIEKMVGRETKRKKKKEQKKTEDGIVKRLAKNGLIDKHKVGSLVKKKSSKKKKNKKKGSSSSSYSDSSSDSDSDSDSSSESTNILTLRVTPTSPWVCFHMGAVLRGEVPMASADRLMRSGAAGAAGAYAWPSALALSGFASTNTTAHPALQSNYPQRKCHMHP